MHETALPPLTASHLDGQRAVHWLLGVILVFAPLFRSGKPALAVLALELLAICVLVLVLWQPSKRLLSGWEALGLALLLALPVLYLVPLPAGLAEWLPGRQPYLAAQSLIEGTATHHIARLSLYPLETESALLFLLVPAGVFLGTRALGAGRAVQLVLLLLGVGAAQALLGLLQYGASEGSPALFGMSLAGVARAQGTYTNPDHLSGLLEMLLPIALALLFFSVGRKRRDERRGWRERVVFLSSIRGHTAVVYGAIALLLLVGLIFARSRAGIALSMVGIVLSSLMFARRIGGDNVYGATGTVVALALGAGLAIGLVPVLDRFSVDQTVADARWSIYSATLSGIGAFSPIGSGPGNYPDVFPAFQPLELGHWFINNAHNDYLEWLFEGGLLAAALIVLLLGLYAPAVAQGVDQRRLVALPLRAGGRRGRHAAASAPFAGRFQPPHPREHRLLRLSRRASSSPTRNRGRAGSGAESGEPPNLDKPRRPATNRRRSGRRDPTAGPDQESVSRRRLGVSRLPRRGGGAIAPTPGLTQ